jgi:hypothetical protein
MWRRTARVPDQPENPLVPFLRVGPPPDRTTREGWQGFRAIRDTFIPPRDSQSRNTWRCLPGGGP